jgi:uncharacterized membrane protein
MANDGEDDGGEARRKAARQRQVEQAAEQRKARAAEKLRENLMRRKAQVRARRKGEAETGTGLPASRPGVGAPDGEADD